MGKITKTMQPKHKESLSPWLKNYVQTASDAPLPLLPQHLDKFPSRWPFPRGDLYHWIPLLNRFDSIIEGFCATYSLDKGLQLRDFGCDLLLGKELAADYYHDDPQKWDIDRLAELGYNRDGDRQLLIAVLNFSKMLLEHCGNRSIYASSEHLNNLLNTTYNDVVHATLEVGLELAQRYQASVKRMGPANNRQVSAALLANHYNIELEKVQSLAQPFVKTSINRFSDAAPVTPASASKGKEKAHSSSGPKNVAPMYANDLVSIVEPDQVDDHRWHGWADIKVVYYPKSRPKAEVENEAPERTAQSSAPSTPTPLRRSTTMTSSSHQTPRSGRQISSDDSSPVQPRTPATAGQDDAAGTSHKVLEVPQSVVASTLIYDLLQRCPADMPKTSRYEYLNRLRVAKALLESPDTRQEALAVRLLAINNLAFIYTEATFVDKVLRQDNDEPRRYQLVYQLAELIHPSVDGSKNTPIWLQTIAFTLLEAISNFGTKQSDVLSALNANVNHGVLLYVVRKAIAGMKEDPEDEDEGKQTPADAWRNQLFSLTLHMALTPRVGQEMITAGVMEVLIEILNLRSKIASRNHNMVIAFLDSLVLGQQNAFQSFSTLPGLDSISQLIIDTVSIGMDIVAAGQGTPPEFHSHVVDYEIPFYQQQTLKWLLKFIHHLMTHFYAFGGNTDRVLRNIVDNSELLRSLRVVIENKQTFGSVVWTNAVWLLGDFINNDPTSFAAIQESGMIKGLLETITGRQVTIEQPAERGGQARESDANAEPSSPAEPEDDPVVDLASDERPHPPTQAMLEAPREGPLARGILPSAEVIGAVPTVLNSISLNSMGMKMVVASRALESFLEVFESPEHIRCAETDPDLFHTMGGNFDELARHHPALRPAISNAILDMIARVVYLAQQKAITAGWGAKLLVQDPQGDVVAADQALLAKSGEVSRKGKEKAVSGDSDVEMADVSEGSVENASASNVAVTSSGSSEDGIIPYVLAVTMFLDALMANSNLKSSFIRDGGIELLLKLSEAPSLPANFGETRASRMLSATVAQLIETSPVLGLPSLLGRIQHMLDTLAPLVKDDEARPFFAPFLKSDLSLKDSAGGWDRESVKKVAGGTEIVKALLHLQTYIRTLYQCFPYGRQSTCNLPSVNVYDYYVRLIKALGPLLCSILSEEMAVGSIVPPHWSNRKNPATRSNFPDLLPEPAAAAANGAAVAVEGEPASVAEARTAGEKSDADQTSTSVTKPSPEEQTSPRFQNYQTLKSLLHSLMPTTFPFFQTIGKALFPRRDRDSYTRYHHMRIAGALAETILIQLKRPSDGDGSQQSTTVKDLHYWIIMLHTVQEMLIDPSPRSERQSVHVIIPVLVAFKEHGGLEALNALLQQFAHDVTEGHEDGTEGSKGKLAAMGMRKILDLYALLVHGRNISDSFGQINIVPPRRSGEGRPDLGQVSSQLVVELRMAILPVVRKLWESDLIEKSTPVVLAKIIEILKTICAADQETHAYRRTDKSAPALTFKQEAVPFHWSTWSDLVRTLSKKYEPELAQEAVYRANGKKEDAEEYCRAHQKGIAGQRNPIPEEDAFPDTTPSNRTPVNSMEIDPLPIPNLDRLTGALGEAVHGELRESSSADSLNHSRDSLESPAPGHDVELASTSQEPEPGPNSDQAPEARAKITKDDLDEERVALRKELFDRCLEVIRAHPESVFEVSELVTATILKSESEEKRAEVDERRAEVADLLANALMSFALDDEMKKSNGRSIAAYAHLLSLLLQDRNFYKAALKTLKDNVTEYLGFLQLAPTGSTDQLPPYVPYVLLIFEILLADDEQPIEIKWKSPTSENDPIEEPELQEREPNLQPADRSLLVDAVLDILPRIGKEEALATSVLRILVILTRDRAVAKTLGERKNLQRLFVMTKQLCGAETGRLRNSRISRSILLVLRHIIEDEDTIRQIMQAEIKTFLENAARHPRTNELNNYLRQLSHVALRNPKLFIDVTSDMIKLSRWTPLTGDPAQRQHPAIIVLKDQASQPPAVPTSDVSVEPAVQGTEDLTINDVKPSTETGDKEMPDVPKTPASELKRPVLENPDGVVHFLLCELLNYKDVEDKEITPQVSKEGKQEAESSTSTPAATPGATAVAEGSALEQSSEKDKKTPRPTFKTEDHPIFIYRCFLLHCLTELLQSYNRAKVEFINFKRSAPIQAGTPIRPRSSVLNYLLHDLLCLNSFASSMDSITQKKKIATSIAAQQVLVALVAKTGEKPGDRHAELFEYDEEPDLLFVRKFVLDTILKAYKEASTGTEPFDVRYAKMLYLAELMSQMIGEKDKEPSNPRGTDPSALRSQAQMKRLMFEKGYLSVLTASIAEIDVTFPNVKRTLKYILRVLKTLTRTAVQLSHTNLITSVSADNIEDEIASASSLSDMDEDREETPDLYRNSALGMLEPGGEEDFSDDSDEDEEMYEDEYGDEMDYGDDISEDHEEDVSDEDEELGDMGPIEGLPGDPVGVEVIMGEDDDDDEDDDDMDDDDDDEDDEDDEDDDEIGSEDMEEVDERVEIVDEEGNQLDDDGQSGWESETDEEEEEDDEEEIDYEGEAQDLDEADLENEQLGRFDDIMRAVMDGDDEDLREFADHYIDDGGEDEPDDDVDDEMIDDEDLYYDPGFQLGDEPPMPNMPAGLGWDTLVVDHGNHRHRHGGMRSPFPAGSPFSRSHRAALDMRYMRGHGRPMGQSSANADDGVNPLLRRDNSHARGFSPRPSSNPHLIRLGIPGLMGSVDTPLSLINDLITSLPLQGRHHGHALHFQITQQGPGGEVREINIPVAPPHQSRDPHADLRRDHYVEPQQAVAFTAVITVERWQEEARMIFGNSFNDKTLKMWNSIWYRLVPPAIEHEKEVKTREAEEKRKRDEERKKREEEERKLKEAKEAEEKAAREKKEAEEREQAEREAAEAAAARGELQEEAQDNVQQADVEPQPMEGVEETSDNEESGEGAGDSAPRVTTTIRGETVDVTELGIDPDYLAALPEEFREEVIAQTVSSRRLQAQEAVETAGENTEVFQEFLEALPEDLRQEIIQQERQERRRRERDEQRRQAAASGNDVGAQDMDPASILLTFPPELREQVLMDQGDELMDHLPPEMAAEARAIAHRHGAVPQRRGGMPAAQELIFGGRGPRQAQASATNDNKPQRRAVVQMVDKAGVATLLRLMFVNQQGTIRNALFNLLENICENRQNRLEIISTILQILQDGSTDMDAVERSFSQLSLKAKQPKDKDQQKTPGSIKRTLTTIGPIPAIQTNSEVSPLLVVQQCLDLLAELCRNNAHVPSLFLTEHEAFASSLKRSVSRKGKGKDINNKAQRFAINSLLALLDRNLVMESSAVMQLLADLLNKVTYPLQALERRRREAEEEAKKKEEGKAKEGEQPAAEAEGAASSEVQSAPPATTAAADTEAGATAESSTAKDEKSVEDKKLRTLTPPTIPEYNLKLVTNIFVARECSSDTFRNTISTIKNLSNIPGAKRVFGEELVRQARVLSENIVSDLDELLPHILKAESGTQIQGVALAKFSPGASEQNKLLRVLTALDHLFDKKSKRSGEDDHDDAKDDLLGSLYWNPTFGTMWEKLSACLAAIRQRENMLNVATILLPLIESLMVVCKNTTINDAPLSASLTGKEMLLSSPPPEDRIAGLFFTFTEEHRRILNELVRNNPKLMSGTFSLLVKNPKVLEFDNKRNYFTRSVHQKAGSQGSRPPNGYPSLQLAVRRNNVFHDSFKSLYYKTGDEMKFGKLNIRFHGEEGVDAGGVTREWFQALSRQMFDPNYALFSPVSSDRTTFHPNKLSSINEEHLLFFKFIGRIIGKALYEGRVLDCYFSRAVYKRILGKPVSVKDMESFDPDYYKSLVWMLENDITDAIFQTFSVEDEEFGVTRVVDLVPNGRNIPVTEENKHDYVRLVVEHKLLSSVQEQMEHFLKGFHDIIPAELIAIFNEQELELLISGLPDIDVDDWKANTEYQNYTAASQQIQWFWRAVRSFDKEERAKLLQFVTGTSKVPLNGFKELEGMNGISRFNIHRDYGDTKRLPSSHTCFNQLDLPEYESYDVLRSRILKAITAGSDYFGFA
ncbi:E3 ubiquitin protein ligase TOM1-like protein [Coniochaeta sp. PMI_546]|nr:E3 ubiquitin protein ligase TOM1-like protein [Coniochaeta sp. PMI_546]